ncbi:MAG: ABC transporter ATP-binding protein [Bacteroidia bacterium]|nr:ABC transporter ATP-binding protein [Bacteroidia bacterium]
MKALKYLNRYLLKYRGRLVLGVIFIILTNIFTVALPYLVRIALDAASEQSAAYRNFGNGISAEVFREQILHTALTFGLLLLAAAVIKGVFLFFMRQTIIVMSRKIEYDLKNDLYNHYQALSVSFYRKNFTGDLMNRISEDVSRVRMYLGPAIMYFVNLVFTFITVIYMMVSVNLKLTLLVLLPLPVLSVMIYFISDLINKKSDKIQKKLSDITTFAQETFSGIRVLKAFSSEKWFDKNFEGLSEDYRTESMGLAKVNALFSPLMVLLVGLSTLFTIYFGGKGVIEGKFTFGNIAEFVIYVSLLTWPVASLGWVSSIVQRAAASQARINEFMHIKPEINVSGGKPFIFDESIELKNVSFRFEGKNFDALTDINLLVPKGKVLGIVGATGSGKSALAGLLLRIYDIEKGEICFDGVNIKNIDLQSYRKKTGYVPQDVFLFSETIADNIAFGSEGEVSRDEVEDAAKKAEVYENIAAFPKGFDTLVGERGITLSGGQKQRIAIARALIRKPELLILDDCLSAVDHNTEIAIIGHLKEEMKNQTAVIISHRLSSVMHADNIIVLEHGKIIEQGNHETLMNKEGLYSALYAKQNKNSEAYS